MRELGSEWMATVFWNSTSPSSCHGSTMASMPFRFPLHGLGVLRGHGMDCRVKPGNDE
ncbi:hypothetical protein [Roseibium sediminicola]|uniref:Uncharacterized protein n=1 Tax=Roseibium sediminicola TaxID=2933272 RepID=A0ABT0GQQ3_9HYPH|nr:hypothetical protein [Roseibium sp. CAU 1639]MCK7611762.1 hypothetical protein [Roseibium sp. CAU 1639]